MTIQDDKPGILDEGPWLRHTGLYRGLRSAHVAVLQGGWSQEEVQRQVPSHVLRQGADFQLHPGVKC